MMFRWGGNRLMQFVFALPMLFAIAACSSGGDGGGGATTPAASPLVGVFIDSPVQGLGYNCTPSGLSGLTNVSGQYNYQPGDTVTFTLYGRPIGVAVPAGPVVTGLSVFNATSLTDPRVVNLSQLLLTLAGGAPASGNPIVLPATPPANFPATIDFSAAGFDTSFPGLTLVSEATATTHLQANFSTLAVTVAGSGGGNVTSSPAGINCGATCSADFAKGTGITLTATGVGFSGWSGGCTGTGACVVTLNGNTAVTATFTAVPVNANLTVTKAGNGTGTVTSSPAGIDCGATCSASLVQGTVVLTATAANGSTFASWSNGTGNANCTGTNPCGIPLTVDSTVTATFTQNAVPVSVIANVASGNGGGGTVTCRADGGAPGQCGSYLPGTVLVLTATPDSVSNFSGWSGAGCSGTGACSFTVTSATTVTANFNRPVLTVQVTGTGSVSSNPTGINTCIANCSAPFNKGAVTLTTSGTGFTGWSGGRCSGTGACLVTLDQNTTVTAAFGGGTSGGRVVYLADMNTNIGDLYLAQAGTVTKLGSPTFISSRTGSFEVLANWTGVLHGGTSLLPPFATDLYRTNFATSGASQQLNPVFQSNREGIFDFELSTNNSTAVYSATVLDGFFAPESALFMTNVLSPGTSTRLTPPFGFGKGVGGFEFIPDNSGITYRVCGLFRVNFSNPGTAQAITPTNLNTCDVLSPSPLRIWHVLPDSSGVVFTQIEQGSGETALYLTRFTSPGVAQKLSGPGQFVDAWKATSDNAGVVFTAFPVGGGLAELYRVRFANPGVAERLNPVVSPGPAGAGVGFFEFTLDGLSVIYGFKQEIFTFPFIIPNDLYKVSLANPGVSQKLTPTISLGHLGVVGCTTGNLQVCSLHLQMTPDGTGVVFAAHTQMSPNGIRDLYRINFATPGTMQLINPATVAGHLGIDQVDSNPFESFQLTSDGAGVVYRADQDTTGLRELYRVNFSAPGVSTKLNAPLGVGGNVRGFRVE